MEEVGVEEVGKVGRRDGGNGRGLVVERGNEDDAGELEVAALGAGNGGVRSVEVESEAVESGTGVGGLKRGVRQYVTIAQIREKRAPTYISDINR